MKIKYHLLMVVFWVTGFAGYAQKMIPIQFPEYDVSVETSFKVGDTITYNLNDREYFRFVFFDSRGKCYCERYINNKLYQKGYYAGSLDTLKTYAVKVGNHGKSSKIMVMKYFQPVRNGEWITFRNGVKQRKSWVMGVPADRLSQ